MKQDMTLVINDSAISRVNELRQKNGKPRQMLRVTVLGGGCSGFQYDLSLTEDADDDDVVFADAVVTDRVSLEILSGSTVRFVDELAGAQFVIDNPNASSSCGCGASFSVKG